MNLRDTCPATMGDQLLTTLAQSVNDWDMHSYRAKGYLDAASSGGQKCDCEDADFDAEEDPDHECEENLLDADDSRAQAAVHAQLAQAAATAATAIAALLAGGAELPARLEEFRKEINARTPQN